MRSITERFDLAGAAVRKVITAGLDGVDHTWFNIKPYEDTGMTVSVWLATAAEIVSELNERLGAQSIHVPDHIVKEYGGKILREFQIYLALAIPA